MSKFDGLIIPRSYNDYFRRDDPEAIRQLVKNYTDDELDKNSTNPLQNKIIAGLMPEMVTADNPLADQQFVTNKVTEETTRAGEIETALRGDVDDISALIPAQATADNQLADKDFVNSTVGTNTAIFRGTFNSLEELEAYAGEKTNNDYAFVITEDLGTKAYNRYKYDGTSWEYEYTLNNSSFTAEQWNAINSGITAETVEKSALVVRHQSAQLFHTPAPQRPQDSCFVTAQNMTKPTLKIYITLSAIHSAPQRPPQDISTCRTYAHDL